MAHVCADYHVGTLLHEGHEFVVHVVGEEELCHDDSCRPSKEVTAALIPEFLNKMPPFANRFSQTFENAKYKHPKNDHPNKKQRKT